MFHLIYTRSNTEYYKGDTFESHITLALLIWFGFYQWNEQLAMAAV